MQPGIYVFTWLIASDLPWIWPMIHSAKHRYFRLTYIIEESYNAIMYGYIVILAWAFGRYYTKSVASIQNAEKHNEVDLECLWVYWKHNFNTSITYTRLWQVKRKYGLENNSIWYTEAWYERCSRAINSSRQLLDIAIFSCHMISTPIYYT